STQYFKTKTKSKRENQETRPDVKHVS
ncbi:MAG: hypothetical protein ACI90V_014084, partial [Bacillariaceae sp.]